MLYNLCFNTVRGERWCVWCMLCSLLQSSVVFRWRSEEGEGAGGGGWTGRGGKGYIYSHASISLYPSSLPPVHSPPPPPLSSVSTSKLFIKMKKKKNNEARYVVENIDTDHTKETWACHQCIQRTMHLPVRFLSCTLIQQTHTTNVCIINHLFTFNSVTAHTCSAQ